MGRSTTGRYRRSTTVQITKQMNIILELSPLGFTARLHGEFLSRSQRVLAPNLQAGHETTKRGPTSDVYGAEWPHRSLACSPLPKFPCSRIPANLISQQKPDQRQATVSQTGAAKRRGTRMPPKAWKRRWPLRSEDGHLPGVDQHWRHQCAAGGVAMALPVMGQGADFVAALLATLATASLHAGGAGHKILGRNAAGNMRL